jgi:hypothetical protein
MTVIFEEWVSYVPGRAEPDIQLAAKYDPRGKESETDLLSLVGLRGCFGLT